MVFVDNEPKTWAWLTKIYLVRCGMRGPWTSPACASQASPALLCSGWGATFSQACRSSVFTPCPFVQYKWRSQSDPITWKLPLGNSRMIPHIDVIFQSSPPPCHTRCGQRLTVPVTVRWDLRFTPALTDPCSPCRSMPHLCHCLLLMPGAWPPSFLL